MLLLAVVALLLAGERTQFDGGFAPVFSAHQIENTADATRLGLAMWAATPHGRAMIEYLAANGCEITVVEDDAERGIGRAPEPGIATLMAGSRAAAAVRDSGKPLSSTRRFQIILNPHYFKVPRNLPTLSGQPRNAADAMAVAWAGEMLHIYFYAHGVSLPHHSRADFQEEWQAMAAELGMPTVPHDDDDAFAHAVIVRYIGYGR